MTDKFHSDTQEKTEVITYSPGVGDSSDLEAGTHTIVPTSSPDSGAAQYSKSLTLLKPSDARLAVKRIAARLSVNITGLGTATHVYCSVRVDVDDADHELFSEDWTSTGAKLDAVDTHSGAKSTIFDLLKDGSAHTFYFLFWADAASQATIDIVQLWEAVGTCATGNTTVLELTHIGLVSTGVQPSNQGSGTLTIKVFHNIADGYAYLVPASNGNIYQSETLSLINDKVVIVMFGTVATDLNCIFVITFTLRSEQ